MIDDAAVAVVTIDDAAVNAFEPPTTAAPINGVDEEEIQIDPAKVEDPDRAAGTATPPEDEEENAPKTEEEVEKREPAPPAPSARDDRPRRGRDDQGGQERARAREPARSSGRSSRTAATSRSCSATSTSTRSGGRSRWTTTGRHQEERGLPQQRGPQPERDPDAGVDQDPPAATNFLRGVIGRPSRPYLNWAAAHRRTNVEAASRALSRAASQSGAATSADAAGVRRLTEGGGSIRFRARFRPPRIRNAHDQSARPTRPREGSHEECVSGPQAVPAKARRLHPRLHHDAEEAELGAPQGRARSSARTAWK